MKLRNCLITAAFVVLSSTALAHDPTEFGGEPHATPSPSTVPATCAELKQTPKAELDANNADVKALQEKCAAEDKARAAAAKK